jgi:metallo-beta-lactamase class B
MLGRTNTMNSRINLTLSVTSLFALAVSGGAQTPQSAAAGAEAYVVAARVAAGTDWSGTFLRLCIAPPPTGARGRGAGVRATPPKESWYAEPAQVADNLYFLGTKAHHSWAVVGSQGIILIEALFDYAAKDEILAGLKKVGLDPSKVKYLILSHAHGDHDGGAKLLQDSIPGVKLVYGSEDWDAIEKGPAERPGGKPKRDVSADDGQVISVGDASVRIVTTPGHTPGTLSYLFEVRDGGKPLKVVYVGGTAIPFNGTAEYYDRYIASANKLAKAAADYGATVLLSNHTEFDNGYYKAHTAANRKSPERNPFDVGSDGVARYFSVVQNCATAARVRATGK